MPVVRELVALFGFQADQKSMENVDQSVGSFFNKVKGLAAVAGAVTAGVLLKGVAEGVAKLGDEIDTSATMLGIGTQALQELRFAADRADVSNEALATGLRQIARVAFDASTGTKTAQDTMRALGVTVKDSTGKLKPMEVLLEEAADGFNKLQSDTEKTALAQEAFGRSGLALVPLLKSGSDGIREMRNRARDLGAVLDDELIKQGSEWDDTTKDVRDSLMSLRIIVGKALIPFLNKLNRAMTWLVSSSRKMVGSGLETTLRKIAQVIESVARFVFRGVEAFGRYMESLTDAQKSLLKVGGVALALAALLLLPGGSLVLLIGLIALIIDDFETWRAGGKSVIGDLIGSMGDLEAAFPGIGKALDAAGSHFKMLWEGAKSVIESITEVIFSLINLLVGMFDDPEVALKDFIGSMKTIWEDFAKWFRGSIGIGFGGGGPAGVAVGATAVGRAPVGGASLSQSNRVDIQVNMAPGQNPEAVGKAVANPVEEVLKRQNREAMLALTPAAPE